MICALGTSGPMGDAPQPPAVDRERRPAILGSDDRAHFGQRPDDAFHRTAGERGVAAHHRAKLVRGDDSRQEPHGRARVARVERAGGSRESAQAAAFNLDVAGIGAPDRDAERLKAGERREAVSPGEVTADDRVAVGEGRQHGVTVRD